MNQPPLPVTDTATITMMHTAFIIQQRFQWVRFRRNKEAT